MRVFQFLTCYPQYLEYFRQRFPDSLNEPYPSQIDRYLAHCYNAVHILAPAYAKDPEFRLTIANDSVLQLQWSQEYRCGHRDLTEILLAQIEEHRTEVIYSLNPLRWDSSFIRRLPGSVRVVIAFLASDWGTADLRSFNFVVSNFPHFLEKWKSMGVRTAYFSPSHDPHMRRFARNEDRPIDLCFVGSYSSLHTRRNRLLESCAKNADRYRMAFALNHPPYKPFINLPLLRRMPSRRPYLPPILQQVRMDPVYGTDMYELLSKSKIVLNAAVDIADEYRGNMRCFEAMGCGACMVSDAGIYPDGFVSGRHFLSFSSSGELADHISWALCNPEQARQIGNHGAANLESVFSKESQWAGFQKLVSLA